jgi:cobalt-zinc-cadmium efflux system membrane fusion protein
MPIWQKPRQAIVYAIVAVLALGGAAIFLVPSLRAMVGIGPAASGEGASSQDKDSAATLVYGRDQAPGLRVTKEGVNGLGIKPVAAKAAIKPRPLPPQIGTVNYDMERMFLIRSRFQGEVVDFATTDEVGPSGTPKKRPLRFGDKVKEGDLLAVVYSRELGEKKAALVDAVINLRLSEDTLKRHSKLFAEGALALATLRNSERQVQLDTNALLTAERTLIMWKLSKEEIQQVKNEANLIHDQQKARDADAEVKKWARVEVRVPRFTGENRELVIVEKNTNLGDMVDPGRDMPLFRLADMSRLQIWVHPPEEYLPVFRRMLDAPERGKPAWQIRFQANAQEPPLELEFAQIATSLEPNQHTPLLIGYLPNPNGTKYVVGQFVTATILVPPEPNTVEIPTEALNEVGGEALVFVQPDPTRDEFFLRRVVVVQRFKDVAFVRSELTAEDLRQSAGDVTRGKRPVEALHPGERVVTHGVIELTAALEDLLTKEDKGGKK